MSEEVAEPKVTKLGNNPFNQGTENAVAPISQPNAVTSIEIQRALGEVQAAHMMARQFPRDNMIAVDKMLGECQRKSFANKSLYSYSRGGTQITGLSIHALKMIARNWTNIRSGFRVLSRAGGYSTIQAFAYDLESNTLDQREFTVKHWRDTKKGGYLLTDERDIYELEANFSQRRVRACLEALIPVDVRDAVKDAVTITLQASMDTSKKSIAAMVKGFNGYGVNVKMIEAKIQRKLEKIEASQMLNLQTVYNSMEDGMSRPDSWFDMSLASEDKPKKEKKAIKKDTKEKPKDLEQFKDENKDKQPEECPDCKGKGVVDEITEQGEVIGQIECHCQEPAQKTLID